MDTKHVELEVVYEPDPGGGWRMMDRNAAEPDRFKNPRVKAPDTIRWRAPKDKDVCVVILGESPFMRRGEPITHEIIDIPMDGASDKFDIAEGAEGTYEYGVLVVEGKGDYTYVRGEHSPPGVIVGGGGKG
jgi:hypothetical protein